MQQEKTGEVVTSYYGIDLHKDQITWHCIHKTGSGETAREYGKISTDRILEELVPMLTVNDSYLIVEASGSSFFFYSLVEAHCKKAFVVNPVAFRELYMTGKKTDRIDAKKLAERLKYHMECDDDKSGLISGGFLDIQYRPAAFTLEATGQVTYLLECTYWDRLVFFSPGTGDNTVYMHACAL